MGTHFSILPWRIAWAEEPSRLQSKGLQRVNTTEHSTAGIMGFPGDLDGEESTSNVGVLGLIPGLGRSAEEGNSYSSILAWRIPWTEESSRIQSKGLQRVGTTERPSFSLPTLLMGM